MGQTWHNALDGISGAGSAVNFSAVTVVEHPEWEALTRALTIGIDEQLMHDPDLQLPYYFTVLSGPCTTDFVDGHFCVGRWPGGYGTNENCAI
eukprot:SAG31_NODE_3141_length_4629_cov_2.158057_1_plen_92_part_10